MAVSRLAPQPVLAEFVLANATYTALIWELIGRRSAGKVGAKVRRVMLVRSIVTLCLFSVAAFVALRYPLVRLGLCIVCLILYLRPDPPGAVGRDKA